MSERAPQCCIHSIQGIRTDLNHSGNRFESLEDGLIFEGITELHLEETLLTWDEVYSIINASGHC